MLLLDILSIIVILTCVTFIAVYSRYQWEKSAEGISVMGSAVTWAIAGLGFILSSVGLLAIGIVAMSAVMVHRTWLVLTSSSRHAGAEPREDNDG